jgi:hypothetical protein
MLIPDTRRPGALCFSPNWLVEVCGRRRDQVKAPQLGGAKITLPERVMAIQLRPGKSHCAWFIVFGLAERYYSHFMHEQTSGFDPDRILTLAHRLQGEGFLGKVCGTVDHN